VISQEIPNVPSAESVSRTTATGAAVSVNPVLRAKAAAMDARQTEDVKTAATDTRRTQDRRATATNTHGTEGRRTTDTRRTERVNVTMPQPEETVNPQPATVSETGTITVGELRSKMKKV
jgi:sRNA-binding protein